MCKKKTIIIACMGHLIPKSIAKMANCSVPYVYKVHEMLGVEVAKQNKKYYPKP